MDHVSFDLMAFPPSGPRALREVLQVLDAEEQRLIAGTGEVLPPFGPEMTQFVDEIRQRWPEDDPDSPWAYSPDWTPMTSYGGVGFSVVWSRAEEMYLAILEIAAGANVIIYDHQSDEVIVPPGLS
jgi:hypothetical protein